MTTLQPCKPASSQHYREQMNTTVDKWPLFSPAIQPVANTTVDKWPQHHRQQQRTSITVWPAPWPPHYPAATHTTDHSHFTGHSSSSGPLLLLCSPTTKDRGHQAPPVQTTASRQGLYAWLKIKFHPPALESLKLNFRLFLPIQFLLCFSAFPCSFFPLSFCPIDSFTCVFP